MSVLVKESPGQCEVWTDGRRVGRDTDPYYADFDVVRKPGAHADAARRREEGFRQEEGGVGQANRRTRPATTGSSTPQLVPNVRYTIPGWLHPDAHQYLERFAPYGRYAKPGSASASASASAGNIPATAGPHVVVLRGDDGKIYFADQSKQWAELTGDHLRSFNHRWKVHHEALLKSVIDENGSLSLSNRVDRKQPGNVSQTIREATYQATTSWLQRNVAAQNKPVLRFGLHGGNPDIHAEQLRSDLIGAGRVVATKISCDHEHKVDPIKSLISNLYVETEKAAVRAWAERHPRSWLTRSEKLHYLVVDAAMRFCGLLGSVRLTGGHTLAQHVVEGTATLSRSFVKAKTYIIPQLLQVEWGSTAGIPIAPGEIEAWGRKLRTALETAHLSGKDSVGIIDGCLTDDQMKLLSKVSGLATNDPSGNRLNFSIVLMDNGGDRPSVGADVQIQSAEYAHLSRAQVVTDMRASAKIHGVTLHSGALTGLADRVSQVATTRDCVTITAERIKHEPIYLWKGELFTSGELRNAAHPSRAGQVRTGHVFYVQRGGGLAEQIHPLAVNGKTVIVNGEVVPGFRIDSRGTLREDGNLQRVTKVLSWLGNLNSCDLSAAYVASHSQEAFAGDIVITPQPWCPPKPPFRRLGNNRLSLGPWVSPSGQLPERWVA